MVQVVTYCRVSSEEQAQKDISVPAQRKALHRWVDERTDYQVVEDFVDEGESAYAPADKRPGFCAMIAYCRRHPVNHILVHKLDRFSRNQEESILFKSLLRKHGVTVRSISETFEPETPQGFLYEGMIEVINQFYSMNLGTEVIKGMKENAERGNHNGGKIPYGYRLLHHQDASGQVRGRLVPGPEAEVKVVQRIFTMSTDEGIGERRICQILNSEGVPGPTGAFWKSTTVHRMLNNVAYVGDLAWRTSRKSGRTGRVKSAPGDVVVARGTHEPLIEREQFEKHQALANSRQFHMKTAPTQPVNWLLSRLIKCGHCGCNFTGHRDKRPRKRSPGVECRYYYCFGYLGKGRTVCEALPLNADWLEGLVLELISTRICSPEGLKEIEDRIQGRINQSKQTWTGDDHAVEARMADIDRRIANFYRAIGEGMDVMVCRQHIAELNEKKAALEKEVALVRRDNYYDKALERNLNELRRFAAAVRDGFDRLPFTYRRQVVLYFVESILVVDRKYVRIAFHIPFDERGLRVLTEKVSCGLGGSDGEKADQLDMVEAVESVSRRHATEDRGAPGSTASWHQGRRPHFSTPLELGHGAPVYRSRRITLVELAEDQAGRQRLKSGMCTP